jgi:hypothetical protein
MHCQELAYDINDLAKSVINENVMRIYPNEHNPHQQTNGCTTYYYYVVGIISTIMYVTFAGCYVIHHWYH